MFNNFIKNWYFFRLFFVLAALVIFILLNSCGIYRPVDAKEYPPEPGKRVAKNIEEGRGFRLMDNFGGKKGGNFDFASSNPLWRASLDTLDFMPLLAANYSGGIIITDWYNDGNIKGQSIKISIRFLTNDVRVDALDLKIFKKDCATNVNCTTSEGSKNLENELKKTILKKAAVYEKEFKKKNKKPYRYKEPNENKKKNKS